MLAQDGKTDYRIAVSPDATSAERTAANELADYLKRVTDAEFPIVPSVDGGPVIAVGPAAARALTPELDLSRTGPTGLAEDGIIIKTVGDDLLLLTGAEGSRRGTLYAVYTFLEDYLGCRWWTPQVSRIPAKPVLTIGELNVRYVPPLEHREILIAPTTLDPDWSVRNKCVGELHGYGHFKSMAQRGGTPRSSWIG